MKRFVWSLVVTGALFVAGVPEASAQGSHYKGHIVYDRHYIVRPDHHYPRWLHQHHDFHRWYGRSYFRHDFYLSWQRLFDIYRYERKYHRPYRHHDQYRGRYRHRGHHRRH